MSFVLDKIGTLVTLRGAVLKKGRNIKPEDLGIIHDACLVVGGARKKSKILWSGKRDEIPGKYKKFKKINAGGKMVFPGFVDSHTHLVFAGDRSKEFEMRLAGKTYQEIAAQGGGIINSVKATRDLSSAELYKLCLHRVQNYLKQGVTTIEIKTGYGLSFESEKKCLEVIKKLKNTKGVTIVSTFLAAHAIPEEFKNRKEDYIREVSTNWLPKLRKLCDFVDIFLDQGYFDQEDANILFKAAEKLKIPTKIHADELALTGGTQTAINFKSLSADHLLKITEKEINLLSQSEVTATLLPTTAFFLKTAYAPARVLLDRGARVALATDFNPGTSPSQDIGLVGTLAALEMNMRIEEVIVGLTLNGAYALGLEKTKGALIEGYDADFFLIEGENPAKLFYEFGCGREVPGLFSGGVMSRLANK